MPHTVQLSNEAYALLKSLKGPSESFSDTVNRLAARGKDPRRLRNLRVRDDFDLDALRAESRKNDLARLRRLARDD
jgi:predicted CopG family antitoxin